MKHGTAKVRCKSKLTHRQLDPKRLKILIFYECLPGPHEIGKYDNRFPRERVHTDDISLYEVGVYWREVDAT